MILEESRERTKRDSSHESVTREVRAPEVHPDPKKKKQGLLIHALEPGEAITVRTRNSVYRIIMLRPVEQMVLIRGGAHFAQPTEACLLGYMEGYKFVIGCLLVGHGMGLSVGSRCFATSPVVALGRDTAVGVA